MNTVPAQTLPKKHWGGGSTSYPLCAASVPDAMPDDAMRTAEAGGPWERRWERPQQNSN